MMASNNSLVAAIMNHPIRLYMGVVTSNGEENSKLIVVDESFVLLVIALQHLVPNGCE
jgi:hypothetical protein